MQPCRAVSGLLTSIFRCCSAGTFLVCWHDAICYEGHMHAIPAWGYMKDVVLPAWDIVAPDMLSWQAPPIVSIPRRGVAATLVPSLAVLHPFLGKMWVELRFHILCINHRQLRLGLPAAFTTQTQGSPSETLFITHVPLPSYPTWHACLWWHACSDIYLAGTSGLHLQTFRLWRVGHLKLEPAPSVSLPQTAGRPVCVKHAVMIDRSVLNFGGGQDGVGVFSLLLPGWVEMKALWKALSTEKPDPSLLPYVWW